MGLWDFFKRRKASAEPKLPALSWIEENPFGAPILDLRPVTTLTSMSSDPGAAARVVSWANVDPKSVPEDPLEGPRKVPCDLRYPVSNPIGDGFLFVPNAMEDKWVLLLRDGRLTAIRSWTGQPIARAHGGVDEGELYLKELEITEAFDAFGDPVHVFDWLVRSHALRQLLPVPCEPEKMGDLEQNALIFMSSFGARAPFAAPFWKPTPPTIPLRTEGPILRAARDGDFDRLRTLPSDSVDQPSPTEGFTALHLAAVRGDLALTDLLLELGANPRIRSDRGLDPTGCAIVHGAALEVIETLVDAGAEIDGANMDGFTLLHAAAEVNRSEVVSCLVEHGASLESRTARELTPVHVACGLGHVEALRALLEAGADPEAPSPLGTPREIAVKEGKQKVVTLLNAL